MTPWKSRPVSEESWLYNKTKYKNDPYYLGLNKRFFMLRNVGVVQLLFFL
jgi:hypothetical protein